MPTPFSPVGLTDDEVMMAMEDTFRCVVDGNRYLIDEDNYDCELYAATGDKVCADCAPAYREDLPPSALDLAASERTV